MIPPEAVSWGGLLGCVLVQAGLLGCGGGNEVLFGEAQRPPVAETVRTPATPVPAAVPVEPRVVPAPAPPAMQPALPEPPPRNSASPAPAPAESEDPPVAPEPAECTAFGPFGPPEPITGLGLSAEALGPAFSADGRTLFFSAVDQFDAQERDENIFSAHREPGSAQFSAAALVANLDVDGSEEGTPFSSFDGLSLYFFSTRPGPGVQGDRDIWVSRRPSLEAPFGEPAVLPAVNGPDLDHLPRLSRDELAIAFVSGRDSPNGASNLWIAQRASRSEEFAAAVEVPGINTNAREEGFSFSADGLTLFLASNRVDETHMDLFVATRGDASGSFTAPEPLVSLNSPGQDLDPQLSPDGRELFFTSDRGGGFELFRSVRECLTP